MGKGNYFTTGQQWLVGVYANEVKGTRQQLTENRVYMQKYDINRKHKARPKNMKSFT